MLPQRTVTNTLCCNIQRLKQQVGRHIFVISSRSYWKSNSQHDIRTRKHLKHVPSHSVLLTAIAYGKTLHKLVFFGISKRCRDAVETNVKTPSYR